MCLERRKMKKSPGLARGNNQTKARFKPTLPPPQEVWVGGEDGSFESPFEFKLTEQEAKETVQKTVT